MYLSKRWRFNYLHNKFKTALDAISHELFHLSRERIEELMARGGIYHNGQRIKEDVPLGTLAKLEIFEPVGGADRSKETFATFSPLNIVYKDESFIVVYKPAGIPTLPSRDQQIYNFKNAVLSLLPEGTSIHIPSRLDTPVAGLIPVSIDPAFHNKLQRQYSKGVVEKKYLALSIPAKDCSHENEFDITFKITRSPKSGVLREISLQDGQDALTKVKILKKLPDKNILLECRPVTGRTHQIRVHLAASGLPIKGDAFYGHGRIFEGLCLICFALTLRNPKDGTPLQIKVPTELYPSWLKGLVD